MPDPRHVWFSVAVSPPPMGVVVLVIWDGRPPFEASLVAHPRTRKPAWLTHDKGRPVLLPTDAPPPDARRPWAGWHTLRGNAPDHWRPLHPEKWQAPLPEPAYIQTPSEPGRMWSSTARARMQAEPASGITAHEQVARVGIDGMTAAELAREMEDMREAARAGAESPQEEPPEQQWWLDPHAVTYSAPGAITMREAEGRLMRAFAAEWWVRVEWPKLKTAAQILANMAKSLPLPPGEAAAQDPIIARPQPTGRDQDDLLEALGWLRTLNGAFRLPCGEPAGTRGSAALARVRVGTRSAAQSVLRLRASTPPLTWRRIGDEVGRSAESVRDLYRAALAEVTAAANGTATPEVDAVRAERQAERSRLNALKARKRQAKWAGIAEAKCGQPHIETGLAPEAVQFEG